MLSAIRQVLFDDWDPIGVNDIAPDDEYDRYIGPDWRILATTRSEQDLIQFLNRVAQHDMCLSATPPEELQAVVNKLLLIDVPPYS